MLPVWFPVAKPKQAGKASGLLTEYASDQNIQQNNIFYFCTVHYRYFPVLYVVNFHLSIFYIGFNIIKIYHHVI